MRNYRANRGPFRERPFFKDEEIEMICSDALRSVNLYPSEPEAIRIDRFIEKNFGVTPKYEPLEDGILGLTIFGKDGVKDVIVARNIDEENSVTSDRVVRSTMAHEGGHGLFHAHLFALEDSAKPLFGDHSDPSKPKVLCRDSKSAVGASTGYNGEWWEFQANKAIGALLMPRDLVEMALADLTIQSGLLGLKQFDYSREGEAISLLSEIFNVNNPVARIRLQQLFPVKFSSQPML
jgi:hypothetical protein